MAESIQRTEKRTQGKFIRAPKSFFGTTDASNDNLVKVSRHRKVIVEGSSGIVNFGVGPMRKTLQNQAPYVDHRHFHFFGTRVDYEK